MRAFGRRGRVPRQIQSWFKVRFFTGVFVTLPVVLTAWVFWLFYASVDDFMAPLYEHLLGRHVPGLGFLTAVLIIFVIGVVATNVVGRRVLLWGERLIRYIPLVRRVYPTVKDFVDAFSPNRRSGFREFVIVEHPREGAYAYGFLTGDMRVVGAKPDALVSIYVPTNHLYLGDIVLVPRDAVVPTGLSVEDGIRVILSAGTAAPSLLPHGRGDGLGAAAT
jgi:uncharacterized membrane protein